MKTKYVEIKEIKVIFIAEFGDLNGVQFHN